MFSLDFLFLKARLKAIKKSSVISKANPFSGVASDGKFYSAREIESAKKNFNLNQMWFLRNLVQIKKRFFENEYLKLAEDLNFLNQLYELEFQAGIKN